MNRRGSASLAALALTVVVGAAAAQMAASTRAKERRSSDDLQETAARSRILALAIHERARLANEEAERVSEFSERIGDSTLNVSVTWRRSGGRWHATSWMETRAWMNR